MYFSFPLTLLTASKAGRASSVFFVLLVLLVLLLASLNLVTSSANGPKNSQLRAEKDLNPKEQANVARAYGTLPLSFEANLGQTDERVRFIARGLGYTLFLTDDEAVLVLQAPLSVADAKEPETSARTYKVVRMKLVGANAGPEVSPLDELPGKFNYFVGNDPAKWRTDVPLYSKVQFSSVYKGIDLVYYGNQNQLEYDFHIAPGHDPRAIKIQFAGADQVKIDKKDGSLILGVGDGEVRLKSPVIYQLQRDGNKREIKGGYRIKGQGVEFYVEEYDKTEPLVIDPILSYSTFLAASTREQPRGISVDASGSAYVTGTADSLLFPTGVTFTPPGFTGDHAFITKLDPSGSSLAYTTLIGGSGPDSGLAIAIDSAGAAYITGRTRSTDFPTLNAIRSVNNLIKSSDGGGSWSPSNSGLANFSVNDIAIDPLTPSTLYAATIGGNGIYKSTDSGVTWNPLNSGSTSVSALAIDPQTPTTIYATVNNPIVGAIKSVNGGTTWTEINNGLSGGFTIAIAVDPQTPATVYAGTFSGVFKTTNGGADWALSNNGLTFGLIAALAIDPNTPATVYAAAGGGGVFKTTNSGGNWVQMNTGLTNTTVTSLVIDPTNPSTVYAGTAGGGVFKSTNGAGNWNPVNTGLTVNNVRTLALDPTSPATIYAGTARTGIFKSINGGASWTAVFSSLTSPTVEALATRPSGTVYAGVRALDNNFDTDAFVTKLNPAGNALVFSTYLGGSGDDEGGGIAVDGSGNVIVAGQTASSDFMLASPLQASLQGTVDAFVTKFTSTGTALVYSTYLGGSNIDSGRAAAVDSAGNAYITGQTSSSNFPVTPGVFQPNLGNDQFDSDAFVSKLNPAGDALVYSTYLGGNRSDIGFGIAVDVSGNAHVAGLNGSSNFPTQNAIQPTHNGGISDAFVTKINVAGTGLVYSTSLGGAQNDSARGIAVDSVGNAYVAGITSSQNFPLAPGALKNLSSVYQTTDGGINWSNDNYGLPSQVSDLAVNPLSSVLYAGTTNGVFKSGSRGRRWSAANTGIAKLTVKVLAVDPQTPTTIYAGTTVGPFSNGQGIFKSTDGGNTWNPANGNQNFTDIAEIAIDPVNTSTIYISDGISAFKTTNAGATWSGLINPLGSATSFAIDPQNPQVVYVSVNSSGGGVLKSTDGGTTWTSVSNGLDPFCLRIVIDPSNTSNLYAGTGSGVFKSSNGGTSWVKTLNRGFISHLTIDPTASSTIYATSFLSPASLGLGSIFKSTDGGTTWTPLADGVVNAAGRLLVNPEAPSNLFVVRNFFGTLDDDAFITKLVPSGGLAYSTYLGAPPPDGGNEAFADQALGVAVDPQGNSYVTGIGGHNFPTTPDAFRPANRFSVTFIAKLIQGLSISGTVTNGASVPQSGVKLTLSGSKADSQITGPDGTYQFVNLQPGGNFTVSATKTGFSFTPSAHSFNNISADQTANFTLSPSATPFHTISGQILEGSTPIAGVAVSLSGSQTEFTTTDVAGNYSFSAPQGGNYTVTPSIVGFSFTPVNQNINNLTSNQTVNFAGTRQNFVVTNTNDHGTGSLRQAILDANATVGADTIRFNIPGSGVRTILPISQLPIITDPVTIDATTQPGFAGSPIVELDGSANVSQEANGFIISGGSSLIRGFVINRFDGTGIVIMSDNNRVEGNIIGLDSTGSVKRPNKRNGIDIFQGSSNLIGGPSPSQRNVISGNDRNGISMSGENTIKGNYIGTNAAGTEGLGNLDDGIELFTTTGQPDNGVIGGTEPGAGNVISGNGREGIDVSSHGYVIQGNRIGTNAAGTAKIANNVGIHSRANNITIGGTTASARNVISGNVIGVIIDLFIPNPVFSLKGNYIGTDISGTVKLGNGEGIISRGRATIGGTEPGAGNLISGNDGPGISSNCCDGGDTIQGNFIGTNAAGNQPLGNSIGISVQSTQNVIGGPQVGARNVISGNLVGILLGGQVAPGPINNVIQGNHIGLNGAGNAPVPNTSQGIQISDSSDNLIGGDQTGQGNKIAFNGTGIFMSSSSIRNKIGGNLIFSNALLGIDLNNDGVTANDLGDTDDGANQLQNFPTLSQITRGPSSTNVIGSLNSTPNTQFRINFYTNLACDPSGNGEGAIPFGSMQVTTDANGNATINVNLPGQLPANRSLTATATDPLGNTSEFSRCDSSNTAGSVEFKSLNFNVLEDVGNAVIRVVRTGGLRGSLAVNFASANISATAGSDYTGVSGTLTFADGEAEKTFTIPIADDGVSEPEETVQLTLSGTAELESLGAKSRAVLHIFDSNTPLTLSVDVPPFGFLQFPEGNIGRVNAPLTVRLNAATSRTVSVNVNTSSPPGGATSGVDFSSVSGPITFTPGTETIDVLVPIIGDTLDEFNELFIFQLTNPVNATIPVQNFVVTILDDDALPSLSVTDVSVVEGAGAKAIFSVKLSNVSGRSVSVNLATANGTATAGSDYTALAQPLTFVAGETVKQIEVPILTDGVTEPDETFLVNLTGAVRATIADAQAVGTIIDASAPASLIQFSVSAFTATEGDGQVQITVTRTTNISSEARVNYQTVSQTASERSDFTASSGGLRFAPGDTSKTFTVLITDDAFAEPPESLDLVLSNAVGAALGGPNVAILIINNNDSADGPSPVSPTSFNTRFFVRQHYHDFLNREPDGPGLDFWSNEIDSCTNEPCREVKRINVSAAFFLSIEFQETGFLVYRTYKTAFGDTTSPNVSIPVPIIRLNEFLPDTQQIGLGVQVGIGNWEEVLEANKRAYMLEFVQRQRFITAFPLSMTPAQFVDKLNQNAGGVLSQVERDQLVNELAGAPDVNQGRAGVLRKVAEDSDLRRNETNRAFVLMQYYGYLRRNPDDPQDTNFGGWAFWLSKLDQFNGNFINAEMVKAFISSIEYKERFGR